MALFYGPFFGACVLALRVEKCCVCDRGYNAFCTEASFAEDIYNGLHRCSAGTYNASPSGPSTFAVMRPIAEYAPPPCEMQFALSC